MIRGGRTITSEATLHVATFALIALGACSSDEASAVPGMSGTQSSPGQPAAPAEPGTAAEPNAESAAPVGETPAPVASPTGEGLPSGAPLAPPTPPSDGTSAGVPTPSTFECVRPDLPDPENLTYLNEKLPDPFTFLDGTRVTTRQQWECRRQEILAIAEKYLYAPVPPAPDTVTGTVNGGAISIEVTAGGTTQSFTANISGSGDAIVFGGAVPGGNKSLSFGAGYQGQIQSLFGFSELNPNIANGWMIDRVMDVLEQNPGSGHDPAKMVVTGCSGCGKGALLAGVFSRVPVTVIVESGGGGVASFRQGEWFRNGAGNPTWQCDDALPQNIDNLEDNGACGPWVTSAASWLRSNPERVVNLPMDQHLLLATIAPRYVVHYTNYNGVNSWCHLFGTGEALSAYAAKPVWSALGVPERMGFSMYSANHCGASAAQTALTGEMLRLAFDGDTSANTNVMNIIPDGVQQPVSEWNDMWIDWDMATVLE